MTVPKMSELLLVCAGQLGVTRFNMTAERADLYVQAVHGVEDAEVVLALKDWPLKNKVMPTPDALLSACTARAHASGGGSGVIDDPVWVWDGGDVRLASRRLLAAGFHWISGCSPREAEAYFRHGAMPDRGEVGVV